MLRFIKSVNQEMKRVVWPTARENRRDTTIVILMTVFFALFFALFDWLIRQGLNFFA